MVRIEVFSNLQCPACRELFIRILKPMMKEYQDKICVTYYEFTLSGYRYAPAAARYVAAANRLGKQQVLAAYDAIFNDQVYWAVDGSLETSVEKALSSEDLQRVQQILRDNALLAEINETIEKENLLGMQKGVNSTPTMIISYGGREEKVVGVPTTQVMKRFLDPILK
jgi:protein-disulfide isomerase